MKNVAVILIVFMMVAGCSNGEQSKGNENSKTVASSKTTNEWKVSPAFMVKDPKRPNSPIEMFGKEGKIGIIGPQLYANNGQKWMWHFWGDKNTLNSGKLKVEATNKDTGEKVPALIMDGGTANEHKVWEYAGVAGPNNGADAHMPSNISLPKPGLWRLDVYIGDRLFGNIVIEVKSASQSNSETDWKLRPAYREGDKLLFSFGFPDKNPKFNAGSAAKVPWYFAGHMDNFKGKTMTVKGINKQTGEEISLIKDKDMYVPNGDDNPEKTIVPSLVEFPYSGVWRLDVYVDNKLYGNLVVKCDEKQNKIKQDKAGILNFIPDA